MRAKLSQKYFLGSAIFPSIADAATVAGDARHTLDESAPILPTKWHTEWLKTAKRIHSYADESLAKGHTISARDAYLRASNYYRVAEFLLIDPNDPRIQTTWGNSKECFSKAAALFPFYVESIEIPYEGGATLPGYFYYYSKKDNSTYNNGDGNTRDRRLMRKRY
jgi:hypothetical protein